MLTQYAVMSVFCRADQRRRKIEQIWASDGRLAVSSPGVTIEGGDDINAHISQVHDDLIADTGVAFTYDQHIESGDCLLLRWSMLAPSGDVVGRGVDLVFRNADGRADGLHVHGRRLSAPRWCTPTLHCQSKVASAWRSAARPDRSLTSPLRWGLSLLRQYVGKPLPSLR